jgi:hypothetical protein
MEVILGGRFENALLRAIQSQLLPDRMAPGHTYYQSLYRYSPTSYFERCGTFAAISEKIVLPQVDWMISPDSGHSVEEFGISPGGRFNEWDDEISALSVVLLRARAFSKGTYASLRRVKPLFGNAATAPHRWSPVASLGEVDGFAFHHLTRLLLQVRESSRQRPLVIGDEETAILKEICAFLERTGMPTPMLIPRVESGNFVDAETFAGGLLNFSPPDALSVAAVRADAGVARYARAVRSHLESESKFDSQRGLVLAMREALEESERARKCSRVFEVTNWVCKPFHYIPGIDFAATIFEDARDLLRKWLERDKDDQEWFLIRTKMSDVSLRDYLRRQGNL